MLLPTKESHLSFPHPQKPPEGLLERRGPWRGVLLSQLTKGPLSWSPVSNLATSWGGLKG